MRPLALAALAAALAACSSGPDYVRPALELPAQFKEAGPWKTAEPRPADAGTAWWEVFGDPDLDRLEQQAGAANLTIVQLEAAYRQARALVAQARSGLWPTAGINASATRSRAHVPGEGAVTANAYVLDVAASWEPDLWGGVRRSIESARAQAQASADDVAGARLSVQGELARDYLALRVLDVERDLFAATTTAYARALQLTQSQYRAGVALRSDVALAQTQLESTRATAVDLDATRAQLEHAIATLVGQPAGSFSLPPRTTTLASLRAIVPVVPAGVPSDLLERRPDIAAAERRAAAANANIGVAQAAFYPSLLLTASGGGAAANLSGLFDTPARVWSLGAALAQTVFDGGLRVARREQAEAAFDASAALYKGTVLAGLQQVEDNLAVLRVLDDEAGHQEEAVRAARVAEDSALRQYRAGTALFLAVITAQTLSLNNQRTAVQIVGRQLAAAVTLVTALGGGWTTAQSDVADARGGTKP
jgi:NodT family efflux transporter outer membrane factor (OMF) lipoprotein